MTKHPAIVATKEWVNQIVIALNLCPFAKLPFSKNTIRYALFEGKEVEKLAEQLVEELLYLKNTKLKDTETSLIVHPNILHDFYDYLDFLSVADTLLNSLELDGIIQIASFHPDYQFENTEKNAVENYTNRSPFPMLHLIREVSITQALKNYKEPESIPQQNIKTMQKMGISKIKQIRDDIKGKN